MANIRKMKFLLSILLLISTILLSTVASIYAEDACKPLTTSLYFSNDIQSNEDNSNVEVSESASIYTSMVVENLEPPAIPMNIVATPSTDSILLVYDAVYEATSYNIEVDGNIIDNGNNTLYQHIGLLPNTTHNYRVSALNDAGDSGWSEMVTQSILPNPLATPLNLKAASSDTAIVVAWNTVTGATGYDIEVDGLVLDNATNTSFVHTGVESNVVHTYRVRSKNEIAASEWSTPVRKALNTILDSPTISQDAVWDIVGSPYIAPSGITVSNDVQLQINEGVVVKLDPGKSFTVYGKLFMNGSQDNKVVLTSSKDSNYGGSGITSSADCWTYLNIESSGEAYGIFASIQYNSLYNIITRGKLTLSNSELLNSTGYGSSLEIYGSANVDVQNSIISNSNYYGVCIRPTDQDIASVILKNNEISNCKQDGIYLNNRGSLNAVVEGNNIKNNQKAGINIYYTADIILSIKENTIAGNSNFPILVNLSQCRSDILDSIIQNTLSGNKFNDKNADAIALQGPISSDMTLKNNNAKYIITGPGDFIIPLGKTLTIEPDVALLSTVYKVDIYGKVIAQGILGSSIVFDTLDDPDYGGGGITSYSYWSGIKIRSTGELQADNIIVKYFSGFIVEGKMNLMNSEVSTPSYNGISIYGNAVVDIQNSKIHDCPNEGITIGSSVVNNTGTISIKGNEIYNNNISGIRTYYKNNIYNLTVENNIIRNNVGHGIFIYEFGTGELNITNNMLSDNSKSPILINLGGLKKNIIEYITNNTFEGNKNNNKDVNYTTLTGTLDMDMVIKNVGCNYAVDGYLGFSIPSGKTLTIEPGIAMLSTYSSIQVYGKLNAIGLPDRSIVFTTISDPLYGGAGITSDISTRWAGIKVYDTSEFYGENILVNYTVSESMNILGKLTLLNSIISNSKSYSICFNTIISPTLRLNSFMNNTQGMYNIKASDITIDARFNYWNSPYGPSIIEGYKWIGEGDKVGNGIDYSNWLGGDLRKQYVFGKTGSNKYDESSVYSPTGNYTYSVTDMSMTAPGFEIKIGRTYNSGDTETNRMLSQGWTFSYESRIRNYEYTVSLDDGSTKSLVHPYLKVVKLPDGSVQSFTQQVDGTFVSNDSRNVLSKQADGTYLLTTKKLEKYYFNADGYLTCMKDRNDNKVEINVDNTGKISGLTDQSGRNYIISYNELGCIDTITDPEGRIVQYIYENGQLVRAADPMEYQVAYGYDAQGYLTEIKNGNEDVVESISYDHFEGENQHRVNTVTDAFGNIHTYAYDNINKNTIITDSNNRQTMQNYDKSLFITRTQDPDGKYQTVEYFIETSSINKRGEYKTITDRNGSITQYERDSAGNITKIINPDLSYKVVTYDENNNIASEKDELGKYTFYKYDNNNINLIKKIQPLNGIDQYLEDSDDTEFSITYFNYYLAAECQQYGYNEGLLESIVDPEGNSTIYTYDSYGNTHTVKDPENKVTTNSYNSIGWLTSTITPGQHQISYVHDSKGNIEKITEDNGAITRMTYNTTGRKTKEVSPNLYIEALDNIAAHEYNGEHGFRYEYWPSGEIKKVVDPEEHEISYTYDIYGNVEAETKPDGSIYEYEYDTLNRLIKNYFKENEFSERCLLSEYEYLVLGGGNTQKVHKVYVDESNTNTTQYTYDYRNNLIEVIYPDGTIEKTTYNDNGTIGNITDEMGNATYFKYDGLNRMTEKWEPFETVSTTKYYKYTRLIYDKNRNVIEENIGREMVALWGIPSSSMTTDKSYYKNGMLKSISDREGRRTEYQYDGDGYISREDIYINPVSKSTISYENNHQGKHTRLEQYVAGGDIFGNEFSSTQQLILETIFNYDLNGNLKTITKPDNVTTTYEYDNLNRQTSISQPGLDEHNNEVTVTESKSYDWRGNLITVTDGNGRVTAYEYSSRGFLSTVTDAVYGITEYYYDRAGRKIAEIAPNDFSNTLSLNDMNRTEYTYDKRDRLKASINSYIDPRTGQWIEIVTKAYKYDNNGNIVKELDALGIESGFGTTLEDKINYGYGTEYTYNNANNLISLLDPVSKDKGLIYTAKYEYNTQGKKASVTNAKGVITNYYYDDAGNILSIGVKKTSSDPEQIIKQYTYDLLGNKLTETDGNGNTITYEYNQLNKIRKVVYPGDATIPSNVVIYQYNVLGELASENNSNGVLDLYTYDNQGRLLSHTEKQSDGSETIIESARYDKNGNKRFEIDGNNNVLEFGYDELNRLKTETIIVSGVTQTKAYDYDANGNLINEKDWRNNTYTNIYDPLNRFIERKSPDNRTIQINVYNNNSLQTESYDALNNKTEFTYDKNNRLLSTKDAEGHAVSQTYDNVGNIDTKIDGKNNKTTYCYDEFHRLESVINVQNRTSSFTYDLNGNLLTQTDYNGHVNTFEYNAMSKIIRRIDNGGRSGTEGNYTYDLSKREFYTYNADGSLHTKLDRNNIQTIYEYDAHGRLVLQTAGNQSISYTYDNNGNQLTMTDATGDTIRTYDSLNRVLTKNVPGIGTAEFTYDIVNDSADGFIIERTTDPKSNVTEKIYDKEARLKYIKTNSKTTTYNYYDNGSKQSIIYTDGSTEEYTYYNDNLIKTLLNKKSDGTIIDSYSYTYDQAHNQVSKTDSKGTTLYTYDVLNRLETVTEPNSRKTTYTYENGGNRLKETVEESLSITASDYVYNDQNRLASVTTKCNDITIKETVYSYDNNGNQLTDVSTLYASGVPKTEQITVNTYDKLNQLVTTITDGLSVTNTYNGEGLRVKKNVNGQVTNYLYDSDKVILELDGSNNQTARNVYGLNLVLRQAEGITAYYMYNGHGDTTGLIDGSGQILATYYYDAFGNIMETTGSVNNNITFAGYLYDYETGLYYLNARMYDPSIARFLQEDTYRGSIEDPLSLNLYTYCLNNPIRYIDPSGHMAIVDEDENGSYIVYNQYTGNIYNEATGEVIKNIGQESQGTGNDVIPTINSPKVPVVAATTIAIPLTKDFGTAVINAAKGIKVSPQGVIISAAAAYLFEPIVLSEGDLDTPNQSKNKSGEPAIDNFPDTFPDNPADFNPPGLERKEYKDGDIIKWKDPATGNSVYEWNKDNKYGDHYHYTPDGKNRVPHPDTGDTHINPGQNVPIK